MKHFFGTVFNKCIGFEQMYRVKFLTDLIDIQDSNYIQLADFCPPKRIEVHVPQLEPLEYSKNGHATFKMQHPQKVKIMDIVSKEDHWQNPENFFFRGGHFWRAKSKKCKRKFQKILLSQIVCQVIPIIYIPIKAILSTLVSRKNAKNSHFEPK